MDDFREKAEAHWKYTFDLITQLLRTMGWLYIEAMVHGYKHGKEDVCSADSTTGQ